jgi:hypothetical protein
VDVDITGAAVITASAVDAGTTGAAVFNATGVDAGITGAAAVDATVVGEPPPVLLHAKAPPNKDNATTPARNGNLRMEHPLDSCNYSIFLKLGMSSYESWALTTSIVGSSA